MTLRDASQPLAVRPADTDLGRVKLMWCFNSARLPTESSFVCFTVLGRVKSVARCWFGKWSL